MDKITLLSIVLLGLMVIFLMIKVIRMEKRFKQQREILEEYKLVINGNKKLVFTEKDISPPFP